MNDKKLAKLRSIFPAWWWGPELKPSNNSSTVRESGLTGVGDGKTLFNLTCQLSVTEIYCIVGWVNLYQKFEIEKYTVCGKLILSKKIGKAFKFLAQLARVFSWICKYLQASCIQHF